MRGKGDHSAAVTERQRRIGEAIAVVIHAAALEEQRRARFTYEGIALGRLRIRVSDGFDRARNQSSMLMST